MIFFFLSLSVAFEYPEKYEDSEDKGEGLFLFPENRFHDLTEQHGGMKQPDVLFWWLI